MTSPLPPNPEREATRTPIPEGRPLSEKIAVLSRRSAAQAIWHRKMPGRSVQDSIRAQRDSEVLALAAHHLKRIGL